MAVAGKVSLAPAPLDHDFGAGWTVPDPPLTSLILVAGLDGIEHTPSFGKRAETLFFVVEALQSMWSGDARVA